MNRYLEHVVVVVAALVAIAIGLGIYGWSGLYNIGADAPGTKPIAMFLSMVRNRSLDVHSKDIKVPDLDNPQLILKGAGHYAAMCTQCHLQPGVENSEQRAGMDPLPPNLGKVRFSPQREFWAIKHGIKMSGMPAWGVTHDDPTIWSMVAFLQKLPGMTPEQYKAMVAKVPPDGDMGMDAHHDHSHGKTSHQHPSLPDADASGATLPQAASTGNSPASPDGH